LVIVIVWNALVVPTGAVNVVIVVGETTTGVPPDPVSVIVCGLPGALSVTDSVAVRVPLAIGVNVTFSAQVFPVGAAFRVLGAVGHVVVTPNSLGSAPVMFADVICNGTFCSLVNVTDFAALVLPTNCVANESEPGDRSTPANALPLSATDCGVPGALSLILMLPGCEPVVVAVRSTAITHVLPVGAAGTDPAPIGQVVLAESRAYPPLNPVTDAIESVVA